MFIYSMLTDKKEKQNEFINSLIEKYNKQIYNQIYSKIYLKSKDEINYCLNGVYITAFKNYNKIKNYKDLLPWLLKITNNIIIDENRKYLTRQKHQIYIEPETEMENYINNIPNSTINIEEKVVNDIIYDKYLKNNRAEQILSALSPEERELHRLKYRENFAYSKIAQTMNIPLNTVKIKIKRLKEKVERMVYDES